jgi:glutathione S-transferase
MADWKLVIGNKRYSSWSLRAGLVVAWSGIEYDEIVVPLDRPEFRERVARFGAAMRVPILIDGDVSIWDSLAIAETLAERVPEAGLWPDAPDVRAWARSVSAEMHSGFEALRREMPMDVVDRRPGLTFSREALADRHRIGAIWRDCRERHAREGAFLFGRRSIADAMFAPVATRFVTYGVDLVPVEREYVDALFDSPAMQSWCEDARAEPWTLALRAGAEASVR